jgi:6-phosphogluconolactonase
MGWAEYDYRDKDELDVALAESLRAATEEAVAARGRAVLVLGGGSTPLALYRRAAALAAPWHEATLLPSDERCVPHAHAACNYTALRNAWAAAEDIDVMALTTHDGECDASERFALEQLRRVEDDFDFVLLGMGSDAHFASLFPGAAQLAVGLSAAAPDALRVEPDPLPPEAPFARVSLSAARLKRSLALHLAIVGEAKRDALRRAIDSPDPHATPISALLHDDDVRLHIHWSPR